MIRRKMHSVGFFLVCFISNALLSFGAKGYSSQLPFMNITGGILGVTFAVLPFGIQKADSSEGDFSYLEEKRAATSPFNKEFSKNPYFGMNTTVGKSLILTFDDGPHPTRTPKILDILKRNNIKAIFFVTEAKAKANISILKRMVREGHYIGNHTRQHKNLRRFSTRTQFGRNYLVRELMGLHRVISPLMAGRGYYFRAPFGSFSPELSNFYNRHPQLKNYVGPFYWDIGGNAVSPRTGRIAADWKCQAARKSANYCAISYYQETKEKGGGIVLFHDIHSVTVAMLPKLIRMWKKGGFEFYQIDAPAEIQRELRRTKKWTPVNPTKKR